MNKHRVKKLEDKKYSKNSEVRELKRFGSQTKDYCEEICLDTSTYDFTSWVGILYAFGESIEKCTEINHVSKEEYYKRKGIEP
jgi:hypothetical protein